MEPTNPNSMRAGSVRFASSSRLSSASVTRVSQPCRRRAVLILDCVTLNVWAPAGATASSNLPVIVYIHVSDLRDQISVASVLTLFQGGGNYYNVSEERRARKLTTVCSRIPHGPLGRGHWRAARGC